MAELRQAGRLLRQSPLFTLLTTLLLALGIGANTILFTTLNAVLLRTLPVPRPEELVRVVQHIPRVGTRSELPYTVYEALRDRAHTLSTVFASVALPAPMTEPGPAEQVRVELVTPEYFTALGAPALYGRVLAPEDARENAELPPAVLSYGFWQRRFAGDPKAVGHTFVLHGHRFAVAGVMPRPFNGITVDAAPDIRVPLRVLPWIAASGEDANVRRIELELAGRLRPGVRREQALAECVVLWRPAMQAYMEGFRDLSPKLIQDTLQQSIDVEPLGRGVSVLRERYGAALRLLFAGTLVLLLLVSANLAGLLLVRAAGRQEEIAVRLALGATRTRLMRQLLGESALLAAPGAVAGWALAWLGTPLLLRALPPLRDAATRRVPLALDAAPDQRVLLFSLVIAVATVLLFGFAPAIAASRTSLDAVLRGVRSTGRWRGRQALVLGQVALCTLLLTGAALLVRTFAQLQATDPGFDREHIVTFSADPSLAGYTEPQAVALQTNLRARVRELPQVVATATSTISVLRGSGMKTTVAPAGQRITRADFMNTSINGVSPEYFDALRMRVMAGRALRAADAAPELRPRPVVVNQAFARQHFPGGQAVGKRIGGEEGGIARADSEIVGVVSDAKYRSMREPIVATVYHAQRGVGPLQLIVRTQGRPTDVIGPVRQALAALDAGLPFTEVHTVAEEIEASTSGERLTALLASLFGAVAALLAGVGLYGALSFAVVQRRREFGIRLALGARPVALARLVGRQVLWLLAGGLTLGVAAALVLGPQLQTVLYGVSAADPRSLAAVVLLVTAVTAAAASIPLVRTARIDPARALRDE